MGRTRGQQLWNIVVGGVCLISLLAVTGLAVRRTGQRTVQLGTAVSAALLRSDPAYYATLRDHFSAATTENELKFEHVQPERGRFSFDDTDRIVTFAETYGLAVRGHTLVWHNQLPAWLREGEFTRDELLVILREHIITVVGRYRGRVAAWDVVNEAFESDGSLRDSLWLRGIGPDYIELALRWAYEADPEALLYINEFGLEHGGPKVAGVERIARALVKSGVPLHGVGLQMHVSLDQPPHPATVERVMQRFAALGLRTDVTEMDVSIQGGVGSLEERTAAQTAIYGAVAQVCAEQPSCMLLAVWGVSDGNSWLPEHTGRPDAPLLFDTAYRPKPAHAAVLRALGRHLPPRLVAGERPS